MKLRDHGTKIFTTFVWKYIAIILQDSHFKYIETGETHGDANIVGDMT